jgi:pentatricopeptide repeat protein
VGLGILRATGFRRGEAIALRSLASVYCLTGDFDDALRMYEEAQQIFADLDDQRWMSATWLSICDAHLLRHRPELAPGLESCLEVFRIFGDRHWEALTLRSMGDCHAQQGDFGAAYDCLDASLQVLKDLDDPQWQAAVLETTGEVHARQQDWREAIDYFRRAIEVFREASDPLWEARAHKNLGIALARLGDRAQAEREWSRAWLALIEQNALEAREVDSLLYDGDGDGMASR